MGKKPEALCGDLATILFPLHRWRTASRHKREVGMLKSGMMEEHMNNKTMDGFKNGRRSDVYWKTKHVPELQGRVISGGNSSSILHCRGQVMNVCKKQYRVTFGRLGRT